MVQFCTCLLFSSTLLLLLAVLQLTTADWGDPPEYNRFMDQFLAITNRQKYYIDVFPLPAMVSWNAAIIPWSLLERDISNKSSDINSASNSIPRDKKELLITWFTRDGCAYIGMSYGRHANEWKITRPLQYIQSFYDSYGAEKANFLGGDMRLYQGRDGTVGGIYTMEKAGRYSMYITSFYYNNTRNIVYQKQPSYLLDPSHEVGVQPQKNWMSFIYKPTVNTTSNTEYNSLFLDNKEVNLFIYSINPHRIVLPETEIQPKDADCDTNSCRRNPIISKTNTVCVTELDFTGTNYKSFQEFWGYGSPHGGTQAVLIDTKYGKKYLTLFHSQAHKSMPWLLTYYMGAYMFDHGPPFAITHITSEPLVPNQLYNQSFGGWAFKAIDYINFPMSLVVDDDMLIVSLGKNDHSGWIMTIDLEIFVNTLIPVRSKVLEDKFYHVIRNIEEASHQDV